MLALLGRVGHVCDLLLYLLLCDGLGSDAGGCGVALGRQAVDDFIDKTSGGIRLFGKTKGIGGEGRLTLLDDLLRSLEVFLEMWPVFSASGLACHFWRSLEKMVDLVMIMMPMLISCSVVSAA